VSGEPIRIAAIGLGKIARDQHLPALAHSDDFVLAATVDPLGAQIGDTPHFATLEALLAHGPHIDAAALCTPPQVRFPLAIQALNAGLHVLLEKPPGASLSEVAMIEDAARRANKSLFATWHSRFACGVAPARDWLLDRTVQAVSIRWREDVRKWHPGQAWIWEPGGLGVFDPGINALSIATYILPRPIRLEAARLVYPTNRQAPIAAELSLRDAAGSPVHMDLDWRQEGPQSWDIEVETDAGLLALANGGSSIAFPGEQRRDFPDNEYPELYAHFAALVRNGRSDVDIAPFRLVADAFLFGRREETEIISGPRNAGRPDGRHCCSGAAKGRNAASHRHHSRGPARRHLRSAHFLPVRGASRPWDLRRAMGGR